VLVIRADRRARTGRRIQYEHFEEGERSFSREQGQEALGDPVGKKAGTR